MSPGNFPNDLPIPGNFFSPVLRKQTSLELTPPVSLARVLSTIMLVRMILGVFRLKSFPFFSFSSSLI